MSLFGNLEEEARSIRETRSNDAEENKLAKMATARREMKNAYMSIEANEA